MAAVYILMGVSGSGKSTLGELLARRLQCPYFDADEFHPPENVAKMSRGVPLTDADREPWLDNLAAMIRRQLERGETAVLGCSALKKAYRRRLKVAPQVKFIFLDGSFELIRQRLSARKDHFMKAGMLRSQFDALEPPDSREAIQINVDRGIDEILADILKAIGKPAQRGP